MALAALAAALAGAAPALRAFNGNFDSRYSQHDLATDKHAAREAELKIAARKDAEANRHDEPETKISLSLQTSQLQFLYTYYYYIWMEICAERFSQFDGTKAGLREILKSEESDFPPEQAGSIWNATVEKFRQLEDVLHTGGDLCSVLEPRPIVS